MSRNSFIPNVVIENDEFVFNRNIRGTVLSTGISNVSDALTVSSLGPGVVHTNNSGDFSSSPVVTTDIENLAVTSSKLASNSVTTDKLADDAVTTNKIENGAIITPKLATDSVTTNKIENGAVTTPKLATDSVTTNKIVDANVTTPKLADNAVTADKIANGAVTTPKIADASITAAKLAPGALAGVGGAFSFIGGFVNLTRNSSPQYIALFCAGSGVNTGSATLVEGNAIVAIPNACTISRLYIYTDATPNNTTYTFTLRKNGANTTLTASIANPLVTSSDTTHSVSFAQNDTCCIQITSTGGTGANAGNYKWIALVQ